MKSFLVLEACNLVTAAFGIITTELSGLTIGVHLVNNKHLQG